MYVLRTHLSEWWLLAVLFAHQPLLSVVFSYWKSELHLPVELNRAHASENMWHLLGYRSTFEISSVFCFLWDQARHTSASKIPYHTTTHSTTTQMAGKFLIPLPHSWRLSWPTWTAGNRFKSEGCQLIKHTWTLWASRAGPCAHSASILSQLSSKMHHYIYTAFIADIAHRQSSSLMLRFASLLSCFSWISWGVR